MGSRANIAIEEEYDGGMIYLYSHWDGYKMPFLLQNGLANGKNRWDDGAYLIRILFCALIQGDTESETGYGISTKIGENSAPILKVRVWDNTVYLNNFRYSFQEYIDLDMKDHKGWKALDINHEDD